MLRLSSLTLVLLLLAGTTMLLQAARPTPPPMSTEDAETGAATNPVRADVTQTTNRVPSLETGLVYLEFGGSRVPETFDSRLNFFIGGRYINYPGGGPVGFYLDYAFGMRGSPAGKDRFENNLGLGIAMGQDFCFSMGMYVAFCTTLEDYARYVEDPDNPGTYTLQRQQQFLAAALGFDFGLAINLLPGKTDLEESRDVFVLLFNLRVNATDYPGDPGQPAYKDLSWSIGFGIGL